MTDLEALRERWLAERDLYDQFAGHVEEMVGEEARRRGIRCTVSHRTKDVASLLKKAIRKSYESPYEEIGDKAGVRAVATYHESLHVLEELVNDLFDVKSHENKALSLDYNELGYLGIHFQVALPNRLPQASDSRYEGLVCEIQVHTLAQNLWAEVSHQLSYKPPTPPPNDVQRAVYRLVSLAEIFDNEVTQARGVILDMPGFQEAQVLDYLEQSFYKLTAKSFDRELSLTIIRHLMELLDDEEKEGFSALMEDFVQQNHHKLVQLFDDYANDDRCNPLLFQPETLLVFERLEKDAFRLADTWQHHFPRPLLESLATIWGRTIQ